MDFNSIEGFHNLTLYRSLWYKQSKPLHEPIIRYSFSLVLKLTSGINRSWWVFQQWIDWVWYDFTVASIGTEESWIRCCWGQKGFPWFANAFILQNGSHRKPRKNLDDYFIWRFTMVSSNGWVNFYSFVKNINRVENNL